MTKAEPAPAASAAPGEEPQPTQTQAPTTGKTTEPTTEHAAAPDPGAFQPKIAFVWLGPNGDGSNPTGAYVSGLPAADLSPAEAEQYVRYEEDAQEILRHGWYGKGPDYPASWPSRPAYDQGPSQ